jgi:hypothetical protein
MKVTHKLIIASVFSIAASAASIAAVASARHHRQAAAQPAAVK